MFTDDVNKPVTAIDESLVVELVRQENGFIKEYVSYDDGYIIKGQLGEAEYNDPTREMQNGNLTFYSGEKLNGRIAQVKANLSFKATEIRYEDADGNITVYSPAKVMLFQQEIEGQLKQFVAEQGAFVPELYRGKVFLLVRNPYSTTSSAFGNFVATTALSVATSEASSAVAEKKLDKLEDKIKDETNVDVEFNDIDYSSLTNEEPEAIVNTPYVSTSEYSVEAVSAMKNGAMVALAGRTASEQFDIKKKEWIIINMEPHQRSLFTRDRFKEEIQGLLFGCEDYIPWASKNSVSSTASMTSWPP